MSFQGPRKTFISQVAPTQKALFLYPPHFFSLPSTFVLLSSSPLLLHRMLSQEHSDSAAAQCWWAQLQQSHSLHSSLSVKVSSALQLTITTAFFQSFFLLCYSCPLDLVAVWSSVRIHSILLPCLVVVKRMGKSSTWWRSSGIGGSDGDVFGLIASLHLHIHAKVSVVIQLLSSWTLRLCILAWFWFWASLCCTVVLLWICPLSSV